MSLVTGPAATASSSFWNRHQPGLRFSSAPVGTPEFFADVESHRYALEPHIPEVVRFERWRERDVLEAGCGIATDGARLARAGARYTGLDAAAEAIELARSRFALESLEGRFVQASITELPFEAETFDLVYSHGVIHHVADVQAAVNEFERVLRPGGTALVMVYHRGSLNYYFNIMVVRRILAGLLLLPGATRALAQVTGEQREVLEGHRALLRQHGARYLGDPELFLTHNTDGPGNPLSRVYSRERLAVLFSRFEQLRFETRFLNLRLYPGGERIARMASARRLERRIGWYLYLEAVKSR